MSGVTAHTGGGSARSRLTSANSTGRASRSSSGRVSSARLGNTNNNSNKRGTKSTTSGADRKQKNQQQSQEKPAATVAESESENLRPEEVRTGTGNATHAAPESRPNTASAESVTTLDLPDGDDRTSTAVAPSEGPAVNFSPAPEITDEEVIETERSGTGNEDSARRPLSAYAEVIDPEDFDSRSFLSGVTDLSERLQDERYRNLDPSMPTQDLEEMVTAITATIGNFQAFVVYAQKQMEGVRDQMKTVKDRMHKKIQQNAYDPASATERLSLEERELEAKVASLNKDLSRTAEELARACASSAESEAAAVQAALVAERASQQAAHTQAEYETRRKADSESRRTEEQRRKADDERRKAEAEKAESARRSEDERRARLKRGEQTVKTAVWESWPVYSYENESEGLDHGVTCLVRADPGKVKESWIRPEVISQREAEFMYAPTEELVSNVVRLRPIDDGEQLPAPIYVALPHCTSRVSAMTREPVIKALRDGAWVELKSKEVSFDDRKDVKFVQAEVKEYTTLVVVTRFKRDFLQISKRGGKETSNVDSRVTFLAQRGAFKRTENFVLQLQPVDSGTVNDVKSLPKRSGLLCASSIVNMEWTSRKFDMPVTITLPCPPNPVKAKKAAAVRAAKEAKMKNPVPSPLQLLEEAKRREEQQDRPAAPKNRWYMGQYSMNDDDDNDILYMIRKVNDKWIVVDNIDILQARLDLLQFDLPNPLATFIVLRTRPNVDGKQAQEMATIIESHLAERTVMAIVKQSEDEFNDVRLHVVPASKVDQLQRQLTEDGYGLGPNPSPPLRLHEGDVIEVNFRGNITCSENVNEISSSTSPTLDPHSTTMSLVYNSHLGTTIDFSVKEVDRFLQKNYNVFRGFVQVFREVKKTIIPTKADIEEGRTQPWVEHTKELLTELLLTIPKERPATPVRRPVVSKAPVVIRNVNDPINEETLRDVAAELGDEWKRVGHFLNVKRMRIQAIMRNCGQLEDEEGGMDEARFEMLLTWVKKVPRGVAKVPILSNALTRSGRGDLAERLTDLDREFQQQRKG